MLRDVKLSAKVCGTGAKRAGAEGGRRFKRTALLTMAGFVVALNLGLSGCSRMHPKLAQQFVYVTAKQSFLRDRVAAVSNRTGTVSNGDKLLVLEHGRRFVRVETPKGEQGWIDEKAVATEQVFEEFDGLKKAHDNAPVVASAVVRDEVYMHLKPGRETERFYRLGEGEKLKLLSRATLAKAVAAAPLRAKASVDAGPAAKQGKKGSGTGVGAAAVPAAPVMEDWWLARDSQGHTGWVYSRMMDVDAPDALTRYAEGQRIVAAYVLTTVYDAEAPQADKNVPVYVTVLSPFKAGLTYDFEQVRVFTWSLKKHRYETAFREKNVEGYLPVVVKTAADPYGKLATAGASLPVFTYRVLAGDAGPVVPDPLTGAVVPGNTIEKTYRLEGNLVRRVIAPGTAAPEEAHPMVVAKKSKPGKKAR